MCLIVKTDLEERNPSADLSLELLYDSSSFTTAKYFQEMADHSNSLSLSLFYQDHYVEQVRK
jgi:hypothetical protein